MANALSRLIGTLTAGVLRDLINAISGSATIGYVGVFLVQAGFLVVSVLMLGQIDVARFRAQAQPDLAERAVLMNDAS